MNSGISRCAVLKVKVCFTAEGLPPAVEAQYRDNLRWIREAHQHHLVVGSQARILYADRLGRTRLALAFNCAVKDGTLQVGDTGYVVQMFFQLLLLCRYVTLHTWCRCLFSCCYSAGK
jgi:hypothetical protein